MADTNKNTLRIPFSGDTILQGMPEIAFVYNNEGKLLMWNKNSEIVFGYEADELFLKHISSFIADEDKPEAIEVFTSIFLEKNEQTLEVNLITKSGKKIPYIASGRYALVDGQEYFIGMAINIAKLKKTEDKLNNVITELQSVKDQLQSENIFLLKEIKGFHGFEEIIGESEPLMHSLFRIKQVTSTDSTVLLQGETGTGKELFARAIQNKSKRKDKVFVKVNCASLPATLIESELFGHEKGAFTGAIQKQIGRFELAHGGTIFLDEIGELPIELQSKLLRVIQEGEFERIGSPKTIKVDVRIIAATNQNIEEQIKKKLFRKDLYYRINVYPITIAPLRDRISDIPLFVEHFVKRFNHSLGKNINRISKKTINHLQAYSWPGNIRELENIIERAIIISPSESLVVDPLIKSGVEEESILLPMEEHERNYIIKVLKKSLWRVEGLEGAARILEMHPETLRSRMRKLKIKKPLTGE